MKENADNIVNSLNNLSERTDVLLSEGFKLTKDMKTKKIKDMKQIDEVFEKILKKLQIKKAQIKKQYNDAFNLELGQVNLEQENFEKHLSLINFSKETVVKTAFELESYQGKKVNGSEVANKLENFKRQEEELRDQTDKLLPICASYPQFDINSADFDKMLKTLGYISHRSVIMVNKKICFFGDTNKIMSLDL